MSKCKKDSDQMPKTNKDLKDSPPANIHSQNSRYGINNIPEPDNNIMFEERSNPLSSKGN